MKVSAPWWRPTTQSGSTPSTADPRILTGTTSAILRRTRRATSRRRTSRSEPGGRVEREGCLPPCPPVTLPPTDGSLPAESLAGLGERPFGLYVHVPFCTVRCGYCDFNTYTARSWVRALSRRRTPTAIEEVRRARRVLADVDLQVDTVFLGGGTPTLLPARDLDRCSERSGRVRPRRRRGGDHRVQPRLRRPGTSPAARGRLHAAQLRHAVGGPPRTRATLDRTHDPVRVPAVVEWARAAGFEHVCLDLIYGTPGESIDDWETCLETALACAPDHMSAYSLIVEDGTALARTVRRGEIPTPDDDDLADKYLLVDAATPGSGLTWYEVSNWAPDESPRCRHNLLYWPGGDWWGVGPGAHSHVGGTRWWNVKHPTAYADRIGAEQPRPRPRGAGRRGPAGRARPARAPIRRRPRGRRPRRRRPCRCTWAGTRGCSSPTSHALVLTRRAGCWPTRWCGTC